MATRILTVQAPATLSGISATLVAGTYDDSAIFTVNGTNAADIWIEVTVTPGAVSGNKQCKLFVQESLDGTNFRTGPISGTTVTDEPCLQELGKALQLPTSSVLQRVLYSLGQCLGQMPHSFRLVALNDAGANFTAFTVRTSIVLETIV